MSPIPSVVTAFALSPAAPSVALHPDSAGQHASVTSQHLLGTGGFLFAVVALVSVAGYFYRGRGTAKNSQTSSAWASLSSFWPSMRHRGSATTSTAAATDCPVDLEVGFEQHVSVCTKFFHPTFWNLVERHPATPSTPAIFVEEEVIEIPASEPKLPGMSSFLDMDDDDDGDGRAKRAREKPDRGATPGVQALPSYDMSPPTNANVNFSSEIIGTTVRLGDFLSVPGELEDDSSESSSSDLELDSLSSPYDGISTTDSELDLSCSPYDGIVTTPPRSPSSTRRYGVADMAYFSQSLKDTIPEEGYDLVPTISRRTALLDVSNFVETDPILSCRPLERLRPVDDELTSSNCDIGVQDSRDSLDNSSGGADTLAALHEGLDLMRRLLEELRDPNLDWTPRPLTKDSDSEYSDDDEEEASVLRFTPPSPFDQVRRNSLESASTPGIHSDVSDEGPIYPLTPPPNPAIDVRKDHKSSPVTPWSNDQVFVMPPTSSDSPPLFPIKAYVRSHRDSRSLPYGPRALLVNLPRL